MADADDQQAQEGVIRSHMELAEAAANGSRAMVEFLLGNGVQIDTPGKGWQRCGGLHSELTGWLNKQTERHHCVLLLFGGTMQW